VTGNATNYKNSQGNNPICSTRDEIWHPSRQFHHEAPLVKCMPCEENRFLEISNTNEKKTADFNHS